MFYFIHQLRLQLIPYVEKQIIKFIQYFQAHLDSQLIAQHQQNEHKKWIQITQKLIIIMQKKRKNIEEFHYDNWMDFRANLILRSRNLFLVFYQKNHNKLQKFVNQTPQKPAIKYEANNQYQQAFQINNHTDSNDRFDIRIKQKVKKLKTEMTQKQIKQKQSKNSKIKKQKKTQKNTPKIQKDDVNKQVKKIVGKTKSKQKGQKSLLFGSRRKQVIGNNKQDDKQASKQARKSTLKSSEFQQNNLFHRDRESIQREKSKAKHKILVSNGLSRSKQKGPQQKPHINAVLKVQTQKEHVKNTKKMTKQQYIQHLQNKSKINAKSNIRPS